MRIKKVSKTTATSAQVIDGYSESTTDAYSCNYINKIIESGSNANGSYIKYFDGTMIVRQRKSVSTTIDGSWGSLFNSPNISLDNYPVEFTELPSVSMFAEGSSSAMIMNAGNGTMIKPPPINLIRGEKITTSTNFTVNVTAIGKWK